MSEECIFCKIVRGEIPSHKVYEDDFSFSFLDINPLAEGHTMVIPKNHFERLEDVPVSEAGKIFEGVRKVASAVRKQLNAPASTIGINNGAIAGQVVPHLHIHVIPRYEGDGGGNVHSIVNSPANRDLEVVVDLLKNGIE